MRTILVRGALASKKKKKKGCVAVVAEIWRLGTMESECFGSLYTGRHLGSPTPNLSLLEPEVEVEPIYLDYRSETPSLNLI